MRVAFFGPDMGVISGCPHSPVTDYTWVSERCPAAGQAPRRLTDCAPKASIRLSYLRWKGRSIARLAVYYCTPLKLAIPFVVLLFGALRLFPTFPPILPALRAGWIRALILVKTVLEGQIPRPHGRTHIRACDSSAGGCVIRLQPQIAPWSLSIRANVTRFAMVNGNSTQVLCFALFR